MALKDRTGMCFTLALWMFCRCVRSFHICVTAVRALCYLRVMFASLPAYAWTRVTPCICRVIAARMLVSRILARLRTLEPSS